MAEKNVVSSTLDSLAVEFGVDGALENVREYGLEEGMQRTVDNKIDELGQTIDAGIETAKNVGGYLERDIGRLFESKEEKEARKAAEEQARLEAERAQKEAEEAEAARRAELAITYILHTAMVTCEYACTTTGLNPSYIVIPESHGEFIHGAPQLHVGDMQPNVNVLDFGICRSPKNPKVQEAAKKILEEVREECQSWTDKIIGFFTKKDITDVCDSEDSLAAQCAGPCILEFDQTEWTDGKEDVFLDGKKALMGCGTLGCKYGGVIEIQTSGQIEG